MALDTTETITVSTSRIQLTSPTFATGITFSDATTDETETTTRQPLDGNIALNGYFTGVGVASLTITYTDIDSDGTGTGDTALGRQTHTYTYYVVTPDANIPETTTLRLTRGGSSVNSEGYVTGRDGRTDFYIFSGGDRKHYAVTYDPNDGLTYKIPGRTGDIPVPDRAISTCIQSVSSIRGPLISNVITCKECRLVHDW